MSLPGTEKPLPVVALDSVQEFVCPVEDKDVEDDRELRDNSYRVIKFSTPAR